MKLTETKAFAEAKQRVESYRELFSRRMFDNGYLNMANTKDLCRDIEQLTAALEVAYGALEVIANGGPIHPLPFTDSSMQRNELIDEAESAQQQVISILGEK